MNKKFIKALALCCTFLAVTLGMIIPANAQSTITVPDNKALILGADSKYLIIDEINSLSEVPSDAWDNSDGVYSADSIISLEESCQIGSIVPAAIGSISGGQLSKAHILEGSNLSINSPDDTGINVNQLTVSSPDAAEKTTLHVTGKNTGISFREYFEAFYSDVTAKGNQYGIHCSNEELFTGALLHLAQNTTCTAEATGSDGIAIHTKQFQASASTITADAPNGVAGVSVEQSIDISADIVNGVEVPSKLNAFSQKGRAITAGYEGMGGNINVMNSIMYGETEKGEAGVHSDGIYAHTSEDFHTQSIIEGKADIGFGVVGQSLDSDQEFPSGGISCYDSIIKGHVNEGMGISSFTLSVQKGITSSEVEGIAEKGLGISVCSGYVDSSTITGISYGASKKHFQVYDSIADSAGINYLSYFSVSGDSTVTASAPMDTPDSFGIHGLLFSEDKAYRSGYMSLSSYNTSNGLVLNAEGSVGIYCASSFNIYGQSGSSPVQVDAKGSVDGIQYDYLGFYSDDSNEKPVIINAIGETGAGMRSLPPLNNSGYISLEGIILNASGAEAGIIHESENDTMIHRSVVNASSSLGDALYFKNLSEEWVRLINIESSSITAKGNSRGLFAENYNIYFSNSQEDSVSVFEGAENGILATYTESVLENDEARFTIEKTSSDYQMSVEAVSNSPEPDLSGRTPAITAPGIMVTNQAVLTERYLTPIRETLTVNPYMAYADGQNMSLPTSYNWDESSIPIYAAADGIYSDEEVITKESVIAVRTADISEEPIALDNEGIHRIVMETAAQKYTVTFDADGGQPIPDSAEYYPEELILEPVSPSKEQFTFTGWQDKATGAMWNFAADLMPARNVELIAIWEARIITPSEPSPPESQVPPTGDQSNTAVLWSLMLLGIISMALMLKTYLRSLRS